MMSYASKPTHPCFIFLFLFPLLTPTLYGVFFSLFSLFSILSALSLLSRICFLFSPHLPFFIRIITILFCPSVRIFIPPKQQHSTNYPFSFLSNHTLLPTLIMYSFMLGGKHFTFSVIHDPNGIGPFKKKSSSFPKVMAT